MSAEANLEGRIQVFRNMLAADPENELANFTLGKLYHESGDRQSAEACLRKTLEINPKHSMSYRLLGEVLAESDRDEEAVEVLRRGVEIAHEKGEYQPRNQMQELLRSLGVTPPELSAAPRPAAGSGAGAGAAATAGWVCTRCGQPNARLGNAPMPGALGSQVLERICEPCWREWIAMSIKVINEYRLNLASEQGSQIYDAHMKEFLGLADDGSPATFQ